MVKKCCSEAVGEICVACVGMRNEDPSVVVEQCVMSEDDITCKLSLFITQTSGEDSFVSIRE